MDSVLKGRLGAGFYYSPCQHGLGVLIPSRDTRVSSMNSMIYSPTIVEADDRRVLEDERFPFGEAPRRPVL